MLAIDKLYQGDALDLLSQLSDCSIDALVTDPPAGIAFMSRNWDSDKGGRDAWIAWLSSVLREALRVLKPGGHALVWALPRTSHWTALALEEAGFEIRDVLTHISSKTFPKSHNISKALDRMAGAERQVLGYYRAATQSGVTGGMNASAADEHGRTLAPITLPTSPEAQEWEGWGSGLKPSAEHWILARKPLSEEGLARNVLRWGTGGLNIGATRVGTDLMVNPSAHNKPGGHSLLLSQQGMPSDRPPSIASGRWPANLLLSHTEDCLPLGKKRVKGSHPSDYNWEESSQENPTHIARNIKSGQHYGDSDGTEEVDYWDCAPGCPVTLLDEQSGIGGSGKGKPSLSTHKGFSTGKFAGAIGEGEGTFVKAIGDYGDQGGASRFFPTFKYQAKTGRRERDAGCEDLYWQRDSSRPSGYAPISREVWEALEPLQRARGNIHATVKPINLASWLLRLITPPGGTVLDCFAGSCSIPVAALREGFHFLAFEQDEDYIRIGEARIEHERAEEPLVQQPGLFEEAA